MRINDQLVPSFNRATKNSASDQLILSKVQSSVCCAYEEGAVPAVSSVALRMRRGLRLLLVRCQYDGCVGEVGLSAVVRPVLVPGGGHRAHPHRALARDGGLLLQPSQEHHHLSLIDRLYLPAFCWQRSNINVIFLSM